VEDEIPFSFFSGSFVVSFFFWANEIPGHKSVRINRIVRAFLFIICFLYDSSKALKIRKSFSTFQQVLAEFVSFVIVK